MYFKRYSTVFWSKDGRGSLGQVKYDFWEKHRRRLILTAMGLSNYFEYRED
jgi:hypothetical protein